MTHYHTDDMAGPRPRYRNGDRADDCSAVDDVWRGFRQPGKHTVLLRLDSGTML